MLSTSLVVAGLTTGQKLGLATVGAAFIIFALISALVLPRRNPNFPGRHVGWFAFVSLVFFVAMISAVLVFGKEKDEATAAETADRRRRPDVDRPHRHRPQATQRPARPCSRVPAARAATR